MSDATALVTLPDGLTSEEANFVYNVEVLDLPTKKAASLAGLSYADAMRSHIVQARELVRAELRGKLNVTKEDATYGLKEAINRARILAEPMTEIAGWDRLIKLHGLDAPQRIDINLQQSVTALQEHVKAIPDDELMRRLGATNIVDADFYEVKKA